MPPLHRPSTYPARWVLLPPLGKPSPSASTSSSAPFISSFYSSAAGAGHGLGVS